MTDGEIEEARADKSSTTGRYSIPRKEDRRRDSWWDGFVAWFMRYRGLLTGLPWTAVGTFLGIFFMRFTALAHSDANRAAIEALNTVHLQLMDSIGTKMARQDTEHMAVVRPIQSEVAGLMRDLCDRKTRAEQARLQIRTVCPADLYRGAP